METAASRGDRPKAKARVAALRLLAQRRLTEASLWQKLMRKGYPDDEIREAVAACKRDGYLDDHLFATLFVEGRTKAVGDARLVAELVRRGIDREMAMICVAAAQCTEAERLETATAKLFRTRPGISYPSAARALERLGFSTAAIYRGLREHAQRDGSFAITPTTI
ncbi:MAG TPA: regulatory protein RecX [Candidatus Acidoferrales bacterium]|nr:regulatory protein RecX [Candidatus Acidoferrales bacterium]